MNHAIKYPRTMHLPWSPGLQNDDRIITSLVGLEGREVVVTEKMDGENTTMYRDNIHARSIDGRHHSSRDWVKGFWGEKQWLIPPGTRICGENVFARHSIAYDDLETYFYAFGLWDNNKCLHWDVSLALFDTWGFTPVKTLWRGEFSRAALHEVEAALDMDRQEGYVVRVVDAFDASEFNSKVAKYVRKGHVQTNKHWMHSGITPNTLA